MTEALGTNPTQVTGLAAFAIALLACLLAAQRQPRPWWGLMAAQCVCFAEILFTTRFRVHDAVVAMLRARHVYDLRTPWQIALIVIVLAVAAACLLAALRWRHRDPPAAWALTGTVLAFTLFVVESISLHAVDTVMHRHVGPIVAIAVGWSAAAAVVTVSALLAVRR